MKRQRSMAHLLTRVRVLVRGMGLTPCMRVHEEARGRESRSDETVQGAPGVQFRPIAAYGFGEEILQ